MKNLSLFLIACFSLIWSAGQAQEVLYTQKLTRNKVPVMVIKSIEKDFPDATINGYSAIPMEKVGDELIINPDKNTENYKMYEVDVMGKNFTGKAMYDEQGKLVRSTEVEKNFPLPYHIRYAIGVSYPGWAVVNDREVISYYQGERQQVYYRIRLAKGKEKALIVLDAHGNITDLKNHDS